MNTRLLPVVGSLLAFPLLAQASDKSAFHLFNPTPRELMRDMSTDRPDVTESPITVDAGHLQVEMSFVEYARDRSTDRFDVAPLNLKIGLTNFADLQLVLNPYTHIESAEVAVDGFGDTQVRLKLNMWGNDGGTTALALMPFITLPTGDGDVGVSEVEGGLIIPFSTELPAGFGLGLMLELDCVRNDADDGYRLDLVHSAAVGREIAGPLGGFVEYVGVMPFDPDDGADSYIATLGGGCTYAISPDLQLDAAVQFGLTDSADDFSILLGLSFRI